jgi:ribonuclease P protein component
MLPNSNRITKQTDFNNFFGLKFKKSGGISLSGKYLIIKGFPTVNDQSRFGFVISNKVHNKATGRNRIKRTLRQVIQDNLQLFKRGDFIVVVRTTAKEADASALTQELQFLFKKMKAL